LVPAASTDLIDRDVGIPAASGSAAAPSTGGPWPGVLPSPSPATLWKEPMPIQVLDAAGDAVGVTGRGFVSAPPAMVLRGGYTPCRVVAWGGPWPVEEHWWDPQRYRRCARFHLLLEDGSAHLAVIEQGAWRLEATYD
jgi:protein ImuB